MQAFKLLLLLGIVASAVFIIHQTAFAQTDQSDASSDAAAGTQDNTSDAMADKSMDKAAGEAKVSSSSSPLEQLVAGIDPHQIQCGTDLKLVFRATDFRPACVKESTSKVLLQRGWQSSHDPSNDEMADMLSKLPKPVAEKKDDVKMDEKMNMEEQANAGNNTNSKPQNHTISLSESMEMGAQ